MVYISNLQLCHLAQTWANHLAHTNRFYYRSDKDIGQNLFFRPANAFQNDVTGNINYFFLVFLFFKEILFYFNLGQEVATYWYSACRQYDYLKEPDLLHANVNAGKLFNPLK